MNSTYRKYFENRLKDNPYYDEIMDLIHKQEGKEGVAAGGGGRASPSSSSDVEESDFDLKSVLRERELKPYRISTMTCIYDIGLVIDEYKLYDVSQELIDVTGEESDYKYSVIGMECFDKPIVGKQIEKKRGHLSKRKFKNQLTMIIWSKEIKKHIKVKIFRTGRAQLTGVKTPADGVGCMKFILKLFESQHEALSLPEKVEWNGDKWRIAMMNGDLDLGFSVSREVLHGGICPKYGIKSNLDADTYPGVIIKYPFTYEGVVEKKVKGVIVKERKTIHKVVTISVFASGKAIITGSNSQEQIEECVKLVHFLCEEFRT